MMSFNKIEFSQPLAILVAGIAIAGAVVLINVYRLAQGSVGLPPNAHVRAPGITDHIVGSPNAPVVLVEYTDFQCPYCALIYPTLRRIVTESNGKVAWVIRNFPLYQIHPQAENGANAAECIAAQKGNDGYFKFADAVFSNQNNVSLEYFAQIAKDIGVDMTQYTACVAGKTYQNRIDMDLQEAEINGGQGTPFTIIYGHGKQVPIPGALPYPQINAIVQYVETQ